MFQYMSFRLVSSRLCISVYERALLLLLFSVLVFTHIFLSPQIVASQELNLQLTDSDISMLQTMIPPDDAGMISYAEFVVSARTLLTTIYENRSDTEVCLSAFPSFNSLCNGTYYILCLGACTSEAYW